MSYKARAARRPLLPHGAAGGRRERGPGTGRRRSGGRKDQERAEHFGRRRAERQGRRGGLFALADQGGGGGDSAVLKASFGYVQRRGGREGAIRGGAHLGRAGLGQEREGVFRNVPRGQGEGEWWWWF